MTSQDAQKQGLMHLIGLAQASLDGEPPKRNEAQFDTVQEELELAALRKGRSRSWAIGFGVAAAAGVVLLILLSNTFSGYPGLNVAGLSSGRPLDYEVTNGARSDSGDVEGSALGTQIKFSDGTQLSLRPDAHTRVTDLTEHGANLELERGSMHVHVQKRPQAKWSIHAGPYLVRVTGTAFDVGFNQADKAFQLDLYTGSVVVTGPLLSDGLSVKAGQQLVVKPTEGLVQVRRRQERAAAAPSNDGAPDTDKQLTDEQVSPDRAASTRSLPAGERSRSPQSVEPPVAAAEPWQKQVAAGRYNDVILQAENRGLEQVYRTASLTQLHALSDAARYARRPDIARRALLSMRERFSGSSSAVQAAFFLGRLDEAQGSQTAALKWYNRYLMDSPSGVYASQALGRKLLIVHKQGGPSAAKPVAQDYLKRFPKGPYASSAKKLSDSE